MENNCIVLGVTGGIAAYKAADLARRLTKSGYRVKTVMTDHATRFVTPLTFESVTGEEVATSLFREGLKPMYHISLAQEAVLVVVAPATANIVAKMAAGIADDLLSTTLLSTRAPILLAPAMNTTMYAHPATQANLSVLRARGVKVIGPGSGPLACGEEGEGRMADPEEIMVAVAEELEGRQALYGINVVVTAGGTREPLDAVRFLGNRSSGKMGFAIAEAAREEGAHVILVSGPTWLEPPCGVEFVPVETAREMHDVVMERAKEAEVVIKAAAVADFTPIHTQAGKVKKDQAELVLELERTTDILAELGTVKHPGQILVGFSAETEKLEENALDKLRRKNLDLIVANDVSRSDAGFAVDTNQAVLISADGNSRELPLMTKAELAREIIARVVEIRG